MTFELMLGVVMIAKDAMKISDKELEMFIGSTISKSDYHPKLISHDSNDAENEEREVSNSTPSSSDGQKKGVIQKSSSKKKRKKMKKGSKKDLLLS